MVNPRIVSGVSKAGQFDHNPAWKQFDEATECADAPVRVAEVGNEWPFTAPREDVPVGVNGGEFFEVENRPVLLASLIPLRDCP